MAERGKLKFERNLGADRTRISAKFMGIESRDCNFRGQNRQKVDKLKPVYLDNYRY